VAQYGNPVDFVSQSSHKPRILDSDASNHITGNHSLFTSSFSESMSFVNLADYYQIKDWGIEQTHPLPQLSLNFALFIPR